MALLHRPVSRHQHVQRNKRTALRRRACAGRGSESRRARIGLSAASIASCSAAGSARPSNPSTERRSSCPPMRTMFATMTMAMIGSSRFQPVKYTATTPNWMPADVHTQSKMMGIGLQGDGPVLFACLEQTARDGEIDRRCGHRGDQTGSDFFHRLRRQEPRDCGQRMLAAAIRMSAPSTPLEKYSALL